MRHQFVNTERSSFWTAPKQKAKQMVPAQLLVNAPFVAYHAYPKHLEKELFLRQPNRQVNMNLG